MNIKEKQLVSYLRLTINLMSKLNKFYNDRVPHKNNVQEDAFSKVASLAISSSLIKSTLIY